MRFRKGRGAVELYDSKWGYRMFYIIDACACTVGSHAYTHIHVSRCGINDFINTPVLNDATQLAKKCTVIAVDEIHLYGRSDMSSAYPISD